MKIAIVKLSAIGDIVHAMVILQFIKNNNINIEIDWIVEESYKELLEFHPDINQLHLVNIKKAKKQKSIPLLLKELKKLRMLKKYDLVIDMQGLIKSALVSKIIPSDVTLGFNKNSLRESLASIFYNQTFSFDYASNIIDRHVAIISFGLQLNVSRSSLLKKLPILYSSKVYFFKEISINRKNILIFPGASFQSKCYPVEKYAEVANQIDSNFIIIWGNENEKLMANNIKCLSPKVKVCNLLSLDSIISLVGQMDLLIGSDSGPSHIAWALNIPSIILFGPTPGYRNCHQTEINKVIESDTKVNPHKINKNDYSIKNINANDIVKMARNLLNYIK